MVRVRFAPSPTGNLHVGNARTAVLNYLVARKESGTFVLRIEDTDVERSEARYEEAILKDLEWLGLSWGEGPYRQSDRIPLYREHAERLLSRGLAYKCFCTKEELERERADSLRRGDAPRYRGICRSLTPEAVLDLEREGKPFVIRLKALATEITFLDGMHGLVHFPADHVDDFILVRQDGLPSYNFAASIDDMLMGITHVIRGSDHLSNTPKQIMLCTCFDREPPAYAHHGLLTGTDRKPLSKRHGATSVADFRATGVLPEALVNHLGIVGRSFKQEFMTLEELAAEMSIESYAGSDSLFDTEKLAWLNAAHLRTLPVPRLLDALGLAPEFADRVTLLRENARTLGELRDQLAMFDGPVISEEAREHVLLRKDLAHAIPILQEILKNGDVQFEELLDRLQKTAGLEKRDAMMLCRIAISGQKKGPPLRELFQIMPKQVILDRLLCFQQQSTTPGKT
jgi:nondiscriminating glutamyl-tRNA synthetase